MPTIAVAVRRVHDEAAALERSQLGAGGVETRPRGYLVALEVRYGAGLDRSGRTRRRHTDPGGSGSTAGLLGGQAEQRRRELRDQRPAELVVGDDSLGDRLVPDLVALDRKSVV